MNVGFIGLGIMGRAMSARLLDGGHELCVHSHKPAPKELTDKGARDCRSSREAPAAFRRPTSRTSSASGSSPSPTRKWMAPALTGSLPISAICWEMRST